MRDFFGVMLGALGLGVFSWGAWQIHPGLGLMVAGVLLLAFSKAVLE